jgi:hypothetical protein
MSISPIRSRIIMTNKLTLSLLAAVATTFLAGSAFADPPKGPVGTGNFRRDEVVKAAGAKPSQAYVMGVAIADRHTSGQSNVPSNMRVMAVADKGKVTLVRAPTDKDKPVTKLTDREASRMNLITQKQAEKAAERNGGVVGSPGKVDVKRDGLAGNSYQFKQTSPSTLTIKRDGEKQQASNITRTVTLTGSGESANFGTKSLAKN